MKSEIVGKRSIRTDHVARKPSTGQQKPQRKQDKAPRKVHAKTV